MATPSKLAPNSPAAPSSGAILDGAVTAKEKLKAAVDRLTEAEAANAEIVVKREPDELDEFTARASLPSLRRLDEAESAAGFSWDEQSPRP
jgi:hypothetical protein